MEGGEFLLVKEAVADAKALFPVLANLLRGQPDWGCSFRVLHAAKLLTASCPKWRPDSTAPSMNPRQPLAQLEAANLAADRDGSNWMYCNTFKGTATMTRFALIAFPFWSVTSIALTPCFTLVTGADMNTGIFASSTIALIRLMVPCSNL